MNKVALAHELFDGIERADMDTFHRLCWPDAVMWQGQRPDAQRPFVEFFRGLSNLGRLVPDLRYTERDYVALESGDVFLFHAFSGTTSLGVPVKAHQMIRLVMKDDKVARIEIVVDTARLQPVYDATKATQAPAAPAR